MGRPASAGRPFALRLWGRCSWGQFGGLNSCLAVSALVMTTGGVASAAEEALAAPSAIDSAGPGQFEITAVSDGDGLSARAVITCRGNTDNPHKSHTDSRRANVHVNI